ncbi:unnamed protein product, partial [Trypanosoma congolense IL3000]
MVRHGPALQHLSSGPLRRALCCSHPTGSAPLRLSSSSATVSSGAAALFTPVRYIIVPQQLKAYGGTFSRSVGERSNHLAADVVLQSLSPSRTQDSPLLSKNVKTKVIASFDEMSLHPTLRSCLSAMQVTTPSPIQQAAIEVILQRRDTVVAAPHGEGKTLAYLLPLFHNMMKDRDVYKIPLRERRPRMILLAPTRELVAQLHHVCSLLGKATGLRTIAFTSRKRANHSVSRVIKQQLADVIIMDPKVILRLIRTRRIFLDDIRYVAVDEADVMLSSQHDHTAVHLLMKVQKRVMFKHLWPVQTQTVFATAFITRKLEFVVGKKYPNAVTCLRRQRMHRPPDTLRHRFMAMEREQEKMDTLQHLLKKHGNHPREILTDLAESQAHAQPYYLSGSLEEFIDRRKSDSKKQSGTKAKGDGASALHPYSSSPSVAITESHARQDCERVTREQRGENDAEEKARQEARYALEGIRPVCWEYLTTVAAPFTCHVPRTVFADGQRCIVFARGIDSATAVYHRLRGAGYACSLLHASLPPAVRRRMFSDLHR